MRLALLVVLSILITGCTSTPYIAIGVGYQNDRGTDWYQHTAREWTCDKHDTFHAEVGTEWDSGWSVGYHHQSGVSCGKPFNTHPELYRDELIVTKRWTWSR